MLACRRIKVPGRMTSLFRPSRRAFLAASATFAALPALAQSQAGDVDVAIVGGGAAGIAAALRVAASGRSYVLVEASPRLGGRAATREAFGLPFDLGANRFARTGEGIAAAAAAAGIALNDVPSARRLYIDGRQASESQYDDFAGAIGRTERAIAATADAGRDIAASSALPDAGTWTATVAAVLGPLGCGRPLSAVSTLDLARREAPPDDVSSPIGVGALLERLAAGLNVRLGAKVARIDSAGRLGVLTLDGGGTIRARSIILAVPAAVIAAGAIRLNPALPARLAGAFRSYPSGRIEHVGFLLPGNPLGLSPDEMVHVKVAAAPTAAPAGALYGRIGGSDLHVAVFGADQAAEIATKGEPAGLSFARGFLDASFGTSVAAKLDKVAVSRWSSDPLIRGAMAVGEPGDGALRRLFADPVGRLILAGEYTSPDQWGTLAGAFASGEVAAERAVRMVGGPS